MGPELHMTGEGRGQASNTALQPAQCPLHNVLSAMPSLSSRNFCFLWPPGTSAQTVTYRSALLTYLSLYVP